MDNFVRRTGEAWLAESVWLMHTFYGSQISIGFKHNWLITAYMH